MRTTKEQWTAEGAEQVRKLISANPALQVALEVLESEHPTAKGAFSLTTIPPEHGFAYAYGMEVGYQKCLATLKELYYPKQAPADPIVSEFSDEKESR